MVPDNVFKIDDFDNQLTALRSKREELCELADTIDLGFDETVAFFVSSFGTLVVRYLETI